MGRSQPPRLASLNSYAAVSVFALGEACVVPIAISILVMTKQKANGQLSTCHIGIEGEHRLGIVPQWSDTGPMESLR